VAVPKFSPILVGGFVCYTCGERMREELERMKNGQLVAVHYYCDSQGCKYGVSSSFQHMMSTPWPYKAPGAPPTIAIPAKKGK
jgi:hypothetical protein